MSDEKLYPARVQLSIRSGQVELRLEKDLPATREDMHYLGMKISVPTGRAGFWLLPYISRYSPTEGGNYIYEADTINLDQLSKDQGLTLSIVELADLLIKGGWKEEEA